MCPRLKNFNDCRLHVPTGEKIRIPENLLDVVVPDISLKAIAKGWWVTSRCCRGHEWAAVGDVGD